MACSKRTLHADNKAVQVSWLKGTFFEGSRDKKTVLHIIHCFSLCPTYDKTGELILEICTDNKRDQATLIPLIKRHVAPGALIITDCWAAYNNLEQEGFMHETVNHSQHFVDPRTGAHTQQIESLWRALNRRMPRRGVPKNEEAYGMHVGEFLGFRKNKDDPFVNLIRDISRVYVI